MGPNGVTFTRILVGFVTLALFSGSRRAIRREDWLGTAAVGVLWMAFPLSMFPYAERHVSSALTGMLNGAVPLFIAIVAAGIARQWPSRGIALGLAVGLAGGCADGAADDRPGPQHRDSASCSSWPRWCPTGSRSTSPARSSSETARCR